MNGGRNVNELPRASKMNYWKTSKSGPTTWLLRGDGGEEKVPPGRVLLITVCQQCGRTVSPGKVILHVVQEIKEARRRAAKGEGEAGDFHGGEAIVVDVSDVPSGAQEEETFN